MSKLKYILGIILAVVLIAAGAVYIYFAHYAPLKPDEATEVTVWYVNNDKMWQNFAGLADNYSSGEGKKYGITVKVKAFDSRTELYKDLNKAIEEKGSLPDMVVCDTDYAAYMADEGVLADLSSYFGNWEASSFSEEIAEASFALLKEGVLDFMNRYSFSNFLLAIKSAGFITPKLINSSMTLDFAYTLFLLLHADPSFDKKLIDKYVTKWYVLTTLTSRYIGSPETVMDADLRNIKSKGFKQFFAEIEAAELSETFWNIGLVQRLETSAINSPYFNTFIAAQIHNSEDALFSKGTKISDLIMIIGDVHHIFPKQYLIKNGWKDKATYNQIANYTYLDTQVNKDISDEAPYVYFGKAFAACDNGEAAYGNISIRSELLANLNDNCIPTDIVTMEHSDYLSFLEQRRKMMAKKIQDYYNNL